MNVQMPLQNTKQAIETASQLIKPFRESPRVDGCSWKGRVAHPVHHEFDVACRIIMKAIRNGSLAGYLVDQTDVCLDASSTCNSQLTQRNLRIIEHANNRYLAGLLMLMYAASTRPARSSVTAFWSLPYLLHQNHLPLLICTKLHVKATWWRSAQSLRAQY